MVRYHLFGRKIALILSKDQFSVQSTILSDRRERSCFERNGQEKGVRVALNMTYF